MPKRTYNSCDQNDLSKAIQAVKGGMSYQKAATEFGVKKSTLHDKMKNLHPKSIGRQTQLSSDQEKRLVAGLATVARWGFPLGPHDICEVVKKYLDNNGIQSAVFKDNRPGKTWVADFCKRNRLSKRLASNMKRSRAAVGKEELSVYFSELKEVATRVPPERIFNYDETNLQDDPGRKSVLVPTGTNRVEQIQDFSKTSISLMFCGSAAGELLPPMVVYAAQSLYETWVSGGPPGTIYDTTKNGWFDTRTFTRWFRDLFIPHCQKFPGEKLLLGDNLASHLAIEVIELAAENDIYFACLPPNSTHILQPLDCSFFSPLKRKWRAILNEWRRESRVKGFPKDHFPMLLKRLYNSDETFAETLRSGFRVCGIHPFNPEHVIGKLPEAGSAASNKNLDPAAVDNSLIAYLKELHGSKTKTVKRKRGAKVTPGRNLCDASQREKFPLLHRVRPVGRPSRKFKHARSLGGL